MKYRAELVRRTAILIIINGVRLKIKSLNSNPLRLAIIRLGGSPIIVAVPPILEAKICKSTKGLGSTSNLLAKNIVTGTTNKIVVTLSKTAEKIAVTIEVKTRILIGFPRTNWAIFIATHWKTPVSDIISTIIIIPISRKIISKLNPIVSRASSSVIICNTTIRAPPIVVIMDFGYFSLIMK